jgi:hypothetical protein
MTQEPRHQQPRRFGPARAGGLLLLALLGGSARGAQGQAAPTPLILTLPVSVRVAGLGGAGVAIAGDAGGTFINPAALATIRHAAVEGSVQRYPDGSIETMGAVAFRLLQFDFGGGYQYLRFSDTSATKDNLVWTGSATYRFGLVAVGSTLKYVSLEDSLDAVSRSATMDVGLGIHVFDLMTLAFAVRNIADWRVTGGPLALPLSKHAGFSFNFTDPQLTARLLGTVEVVWTERAPRRTILGLEAGAVISGVGVVGRAGWGAQPEGSGQKELSLGGGVVLSRFNIDYAWQRRTKLGNQVHRLGVRFTI